jgi:hypothetical protein
LKEASNNKPKGDAIMNKHIGYKANLLRNARYQMKQVGGRVIVHGEHVKFYAKDGRSCTVWYPVESRVNDLEIDDLKEAIEYMTGYPAFTIHPTYESKNH